MSYVLKKANNAAIKYACLKFHYAKSIPVNVFGYNVYYNDEWCGVILFGTGANNNIAKMYGLVQGQVIELVRIALNGKQKNVTEPLAIALRLIKKDLPLVKIIVSYADLDQQHVGTIYQATNWIFTGTSMKDKADASFIVNGKRIHGKTLSDKCKRKGMKKSIETVKALFKTDDVIPYITKGKHKYIYQVDKSLLQLCKERSQPYPKADIV